MGVATSTGVAESRSELIQRTVRNSFSASVGPLSPRELFKQIEDETGAGHHEALEVVRTMIEEGELMLTDDFNLQLKPKCELAA